MSDLWTDALARLDEKVEELAEPPTCPWCGRALTACQCDPDEAPF